jgi:hypothetical protein
MIWVPNIATMYCNKYFGPHCYNAIDSHCCNNTFQQWPWSCRLPSSLKNMRDSQTHMDGPISCPSLMLSYEQHLKSEDKQQIFCVVLCPTHLQYWQKSPVAQFWHSSQMPIPWVQVEWLWQPQLVPQSTPVQPRSHLQA